MSEENKTDPWEREAVSIHLSRRRRALLKAYSKRHHNGMTPGEALYSLIDLSAPPLPLPSAEPAIAGIEGLTGKVHYLMKKSEADAHLLSESTAAIKALSEVLGPIQNIMATLGNDQSDTYSFENSGSSDQPLLPGPWIQQALAASERQAENRMVVACQWISTELQRQSMALVLRTSILKSTARGKVECPLPNLHIKNLAMNWQIAKMFCEGVAAKLFLVCSRSHENRWQGILVSESSTQERKQLLSFEL
jgi:hypothetical protein